MNNKGMQKLYVGDIGFIPTPVDAPIIDLEHVDTLTDRQLFSYAIECGVPLKNLIGINHCYEHVEMIAIGDRPLPSGFNYYEHCKYCKSCFLMFRKKRK